MAYACRQGGVRGATLENIGAAPIDAIVVELKEASFRASL